MTIAQFNALDKDKIENLLETCCGSSKWKEEMLKALPFGSEKDLVITAEESWYNECSSADWLEAFTHHPKIGDKKSLTEKFSSTSHLAGNEQSGVDSATEDIIDELAAANEQYERKFGFIFIVCATGKSAAEMLRLLSDRLNQSLEEELTIAMGEQHKITILRLRKLISDGDWSQLNVSQITTHVLDTTLGKPGANITIRLKSFTENVWKTVAIGITNADGRIGDLLPQEKFVKPANYKMVFDTGSYFNSLNVKGFYPVVEIDFTVFDNLHYHVPLLINPFGFSTYRGS